MDVLLWIHPFSTQFLRLHPASASDGGGFGASRGCQLGRTPGLCCCCLAVGSHPTGWGGMQAPSGNQGLVGSQAAEPSPGRVGWGDLLALLHLGQGGMCNCFLCHCLGGTGLSCVSPCTPAVPWLLLTSPPAMCLWPWEGVSVASGLMVAPKPRRGPVMAVGTASRL